MKFNKVFRILALAVILSLLMLAIPATPALAAPAITLSATYGPPGTIITVATVTGSEFTATNTSGYVWFDDGDEVRETGEPQVSVTTTGTGALPAGVTLTVPVVPRDIYQVRADIPIGDAIDAEADFTVTPGITLSASSGKVGDTITVSGNGFKASAGITIYYDNVSKGTTTATATGTFTGFSLTVPESTKGNHTIKAQETSDTIYNDTATFTVSPEITVYPTSGSVDDEVTVNGTGFADDSDITIYFDGDEVAISGDDETDDDGSFECTFVVPEASRGSHDVRAEDDEDNDATATFSVAQSIVINPTSGASGITVTVTGTGFAANKTVTITYNDVAVTTSPSPVTTDSEGYFTATFVVPAGNAGTYVVRATDASNNTATANFTSTTDATIDKTTTAADPGHVGMELTITGTGFTPNSTATITYTSETVTLANPPTDANGNFSVEITIPASGAGAHTITVKDDTTGAIVKTFTFYMESEAPEAPSLLLPAEGTKLEEGQFDWEGVTDDSEPVTYDLQVATDADFENILLDKTGLSTSAYTLLEAEKLESTGEEAPYYWRVRAVDAASNAGDWSDAGTFTVGLSFEFTGWIVWVTMIVVAIVFLLIGIWIGRRMGGGYY